MKGLMVFAILAVLGVVVLTGCAAPDQLGHEHLGVNLGKGGKVGVNVGGWNFGLGGGEYPEFQLGPIAFQHPNIRGERRVDNALRAAQARAQNGFQRDLVHARDENGFTPLHSAAAFGTSRVVRALLDAGADVNARGEDGRTPLHIAAGYSEALVVVQALLAGGADVHARANDGRTPCDMDERRHLVRLGAC